MKNKDPEVMAAYVSGAFLVKMVLYTIGILGLGFIILSPAAGTENFTTAMFFVLWPSFGGAVAAIIILYSGMRLPGYQAAVASYSTDRAEKARMKAKYQAVKSTKPCNLSRNQVLISAGAGFVIAAALAMTL
jgi:hypothetical protein